jgi:hypothetical protein
VQKYPCGVVFICDVTPDFSLVSIAALALAIAQPVLGEAVTTHVSPDFPLVVQWAALTTPQSMFVRGAAPAVETIPKRSAESTAETTKGLRILGWIAK